MQTGQTHFEVQHGTAADVAELTVLFFRAVRIGAASAYSPQQRRAWAPLVPDISDWTKRLAGQTVFLVRNDEICLGFMTLDATGLIDLAFVDPDHAGKGVAYALYQTLEAEARQQGLVNLRTEASEQARVFFERQGWAVEARQMVTLRGVDLHNYRMSKSLD